MVARHPCTDPIEIEISGFGEPGVDDGMHRLYAAAIRRDEAVLVRIGGHIDYCPLALGVACVFEEADRTPGVISAASEPAN